ncbi:hypothetical protein D9619_008115 [Psilocybe cf. subviscida]|uniref:Uncharacterized protein n=1 Tax=Psilocybe cf. subviscida TaxID=2480587 RepID=A0A8H5ATL3_9AGAR|nr:hypothetical protein D9619_008115 [Psilocybe cf. subviscida]
MTSPFTLDQKIALITGAAGGIGLATTKAFLNANVKGLLLVDLSEEALKKAVNGLAPEDQARCEVFASDVSSPDQAFYAQRAFERWGRLDIAILNAGICLPHASILDTEVEAWDKTMAVNSRGVFIGLRECAKIMVKQNSGSIVITSSQAGLEGLAGLSAYCASKWAVRGLALTAAQELTPLGIRVNSICPGPIETPLTNAFSEERRSTMKEPILMQRFGQPEEIANAILYLSSDAASYCSGTTLKIDGGLSKFG